MAYLRRLPRFEYLSPDTVENACAMLSTHGGSARVLAGGTDLLLQMRKRETVPDYVVGLKGIAELAYIRASADGGLAIGAMTPIQALLASPQIQDRYGVLAEAAAGIGGLELRHVATIGGNVAGALPCADLPPALIALGAQAKFRRGNEERQVPVEHLFPEFGRTIARPDELLTEIQIPATPAASGGAYFKFHDRQSMDMTTIGVSAVVAWDEDNEAFRDVRIALASSAPVPMRARKAEAALRGRPLAEDALEQAARAVCEEADPRDSWRAAREFRFELLCALTKRAVRCARDRAVPPKGGQA